MRRLIVVLAFAVACGAPTTPDGPQTLTKIRVNPRSATIGIGETQSLSAATLDSAGDSTGLASVTWTSSASLVASVSNEGVTTGLAPGVTTVIATASGGRRDSARITVVEDACDGIAHAAQLQGTATFTFAFATQLGSVQYAVSDGSTMTFTADAGGPGQNGHQLWFGSATGTGSEQETRTDHESNTVQTLTGDGPLVVRGIDLSQHVINVDVSACTYTLEGNPYIDVTASPTGGDLGPSWIGWFRTAPTPCPHCSPTRRRSPRTP